MQDTGDLEELQRALAEMDEMRSKGFRLPDGIAEVVTGLRQLAAEMDEMRSKGFRLPDGIAEVVTGLRQLAAEMNVVPSRRWWSTTRR